MFSNKRGKDRWLLALAGLVGLAAPVYGVDLPSFNFYGPETINLGPPEAKQTATGTVTVAALPNVIYAQPYIATDGGDPLHAAFADCPKIGRTNGMQIKVGTGITDPNGNLEIGLTAGNASSSSPNWPPAGKFGQVTQDGSGSWKSAGLSAAAASPCTVIATYGNYTLPSDLILGVGGPNSTEVLVMYPGAGIKVTGGQGHGHAGIVVANKGAVTGVMSQNSGSISGQSGASLSAIVESWCGFAKEGLGINLSCPNMDVENIYIGAGSAKLDKAVLWTGGVQGQGNFSDLAIALGSANQVGVLVDDPFQQWNALLFKNNWILGNHETGVNGVGYRFRCGYGASGGSQAAQIVGGAIVDFAGTNPIWIDVDGASSGTPCKSILVAGQYLETSNQQAGTGIGLNIKNAVDFEAYGINANGGPRLDALVKVSGSGSVRVKGYCFGNVCNGSSTKMIQNTITGYTDTGKGDFDYTYTPGPGKGVAFDGLPVRSTGGFQQGN